MGCKYSKVIPKGKQEERVRSARGRKKEPNTPVGAGKDLNAVQSNPRDLTTEEILDDLYSKGFIKNPKKSCGGVAFDIGTTGLPLKPPRRLEKIVKTAENDMYTAEEKALMAEMVREEEAKNKAWKRDLKHDKAKRKRMFREAEKKAKVENKRKKYDQRMDEMAKKMA